MAPKTFDQAVFRVVFFVLVQPGGAGATGRFSEVLKRRQPPSSLAGLCFYGLVTAMFLRAQWLGLSKADNFH